MKRSTVGCIDPHGVWPFAADRATCPKCQAIGYGAPIHWWQRVHPDTWTCLRWAIVVGLAAGVLLALLACTPADPLVCETTANGGQACQRFPSPMSPVSPVVTP